MNAMIPTIPPNPPRTPPANLPASTGARPGTPPADGGFSQELKKAKSKPTASPQPKPATSAASKKANAKSTPDKNNSKSAPKQQNPAEPDSGSDPHAKGTGEFRFSRHAGGESGGKCENSAPGCEGAGNRRSLSESQLARQDRRQQIEFGRGGFTNFGESHKPAVHRRIQLSTRGYNGPNPPNDAAAQQFAGSPNAVESQTSNSAGPASEANTPPPPKAKAIPVNFAASETNQPAPDSSTAAASPSTSTSDSPSPDLARPADFESAIQSAAQLLPDLAAGAHPAAHSPQSAPVALPPPPSPVAQFADTNQPSIVSTIRGSLLPNGGTMNIALNPPDLGAMQITVRMGNGAMSASFQTSNDQATRLLTHSLGQLKNALETQGVSVDRLHVHQVSNSESASGKGGDSESKDGQSSDGRNAQQEQQRRDTLRRMWRRARGEPDPLDLVA